MTTALAVVVVAAVAAVISYQHAFELVRVHGESGTTARLVPFTVDGLIWAASMAILDASRRSQPAPVLAKWSLGVGIAATIGANLAHGMSHGPIGAIVSAWPALALVGAFELLMTLTRKAASPAPAETSHQRTVRTSAKHAIRNATDMEQTPEQAVLSDYLASNASSPRNTPSTVARSAASWPPWHLRALRGTEKPKPSRDELGQSFLPLAISPRGL
jgi:uncharacterized protein DUF2637